MLHRPFIRTVLALALIGWGAVSHGARLEAAVSLQVNATFTIPDQPAVVDLNGPAAGTGYNATFIQGRGPAAIVDPLQLSVQDPVSGTLSSATVTLTNPLDGTAESLAVTVLGAITASYNSTTGVLTLSGSDTVADYQNVLRTLTYNNIAFTPNATTRIVDVSVSDGILSSNVAVSNVTIIPAAPVVDLNGPLVAGLNYNATFNEGGGAVSIVASSALTISDVNSTTLVGATITITNPLDEPSETVNVATVGNITQSYNASTGVLTLSGTDSLTNYQTVLQSLTYNNTASSMHPGARLVQVVVSDGSLSSAPVTSTVTVFVLNLTPTLDPISNITILENSGVLSVPLTGITNGGNVQVQTLTITAVSSQQSLVLNPSITYTSPNATGTLLLAPVYDQFGVTTISVTINNNGGTALGSIPYLVRTFTVTVLPVNQPPTLTALSNLTIAENAPVQTVPLTGISAGPASESSQSLTVTASSSVPGLIPNPTVFYSSPQSTGVITFQPVANQSGTAVILVTVTDSGGTANGGINQVSQSFTVTVTPALQLPVIVANTGLTVQLQGTGVVTYQDLEVSDSGAPDQLVYTLASVPTEGILTLSNTTLTTGNTFTQADIDSGLLLYTSTGSVAGSDQFTFTLQDSGGGTLPLTTFPITITGTPVVGTIPFVALPGPTITWVEGTPQVLLDTSATVADASGTLVGGLLTISEVGTVFNGDILSIINQGTGSGQISVSGSTVSYAGTSIGSESGGTLGSSLTINLSGGATPSTVQALLRDIGFSNTDVPPSSTTRLVQVVLSNGTGGVSSPVIKFVQVEPVALAPIVTLNGPTVIYLQQSGPVGLTPTSTVADPYVVALTGGVLTATWTANGASEDNLEILNQGTAPGQISVVGSAVTYEGSIVGFASGGNLGAPLTVALTSLATPAATTAMLQALGYNNQSPTPSLAVRQLTITVSDGLGGTSAPVILSVVVRAVDNPPVVILPSGPLLYLQGSGDVQLDPLATITDATLTSFPGGVLSVSFVSGGQVNDQLVVQNQGTAPGQISVVGTNAFYSGTLIGQVTGPGTSTSPLLILLNGNASIAATQALLRQVCMLNSAVPPIGGARTVQVTLQDGLGATSAPVQVVVTVRVIDVPPVVTLPSPPANWLEGTAAIAIDAAATVTDVDSPNFTGGGLTVTLLDGQTGDVLALGNQGTQAGQVSVSGANVLFGGVIIGTQSGGSGTTPLTIAMNSASTPAAAQAVLRDVLYSYSVPFTANQTRTIQAVASDGETSSGAGTTINLVWQRTTPVASNLVLSTVMGLAVSGVLPATDAEGFALTWTIATQPTQGSVTLGSGGAITYTPTNATSGSDSFTFTVTDGVLTSAPATVSIVATSRLDTPHPQVISSPPREGFLTQPITYMLEADISQLGSGTDLQFQVVGGPSGVTVVKTGATTATITWTATGTPEVHQQIGILVTDPVSGSSTYQPIQVLWHASVGGSS